MTKEQLLAEAMALDPKDRDELAEAIHQSVELEPLTDEQRNELLRRAKAIDDGKAELIPADEVLRRLRERSRR
jgi:putative addiction module component (TIGR02574 family)